MKNLLFLFFAFLISIHIVAQPTFEKTFGTMDNDQGYSVSICNDNSYIISGYIANLYTGGTNIYVAKISIFGDTIWTRIEGVPYYDDYGMSVKQTMDDGFIVTGYTIANESWVPFLLKYDENGNKEWYNDYSNYVSSGIGYSVLQTADSGFVFCGNSDYYNDKDAKWGSKACLLKTDKNGNYAWHNTYGSYGVHYAPSLCFAGDGGFVVSGLYDTEGEYTDAWLFKTNPSGTLIWNKVYGGAENMEDAWSVKKTEDGGYILCGTVFYGIIAMYGDFYVVKTNSNGILQWSKTYGADGDDRGSSVDTTSDGGYIFCGTTDSFGNGNLDIWLVRTNSAGDTLWTRRYGGIYDEYAGEVRTTADDGFVVCGSTNSIGNGGDDIYLFKTNWYGTLTDVPVFKQNDETIEVIPNPGEGIFSITNCPDNAELEITDINGKVVLHEYRYSSVTQGHEIDIRKSNAGIYLLKISSPQGIKTCKLLKK
jgi:hypothetical protein